MYLLDVNIIVNEVLFLIRQMTPFDTSLFNMKKTCEDLETIILEKINSVISAELNTLLPNKITNCLWIGSDIPFFIESIDDCNRGIELSHECIDTLIGKKSRSYYETNLIINKIIPPNGFDIWEVRKQGLFFYLINLGDFRILEWEADHIRNGKYVSNQSEQDEATTVQMLIDREIDQHQAMLERMGIQKHKPTWRRST